MKQKLITSRQIADRFGVAMITVQKWHKRGLIKAVETINGRHRFLAEDVEKLIKPAKNG